MDMDRYIGRLLDNRYEILEIIGTGGMAVVYKARCHRLNRLVAIKILKDEYSRDEEFRRRFHAESQAVAMLSHPNIVSVYDVSTSDEADYIVMELIDGITLKQYMEKKGVLNWKETLHFAIQIAKALEHAHQKGIVHRDIKPHNIMVLKDGSVRVADFGIARVMSKGNTLTKEALGSVHYISPEQAKGGRVDTRSDLYSLGIVMYEMITGRTPYDGESPVAVAIQHINGGAQLPSTLNPNIPGGLEQIIMKAMAHDLKDRYATATEMLYDMDEFRKNPSMLFEFGDSAAEDATRILPLPQDLHAAEQPRVGRREGTAGQPGRGTKRKPQPPRREAHRSRAATIAVIACSAVALIAICVFLVALAQGGAFGSNNNLVRVPSLKGRQVESLPEYREIQVVVQGQQYSYEYEKGQIIEQKPEAGIMVARGTTVQVTVSLGAEPPAVTMEDLVDSNAEQAEHFLNGIGIHLNILRREENSATIAEGHVTRTDPEEGTPLSDGQTVTLWVSIGPEVKRVPMPNVLTLDVEKAKNILNASGFHNIKIVPVDSSMDKDVVVHQSEERNTMVDVTTEIVLQVSRGPTSQPTQPVVTEPSSEPTQPDEGLVTKEVVFEVPQKDKNYLLSIEMGGKLVVDRMEILSGTRSITVPLKGSGEQVCKLYVDGVFETQVTVNFGTES